MVSVVLQFGNKFERNHPKGESDNCYWCQHYCLQKICSSEIELYHHSLFSHNADLLWRKWKGVFFKHSHSHPISLRHLTYSVHIQTKNRTILGPPRGWSEHNFFLLHPPLIFKPCFSLTLNIYSIHYILWNFCTGMTITHNISHFSELPVWMVARLLLIIFSSMVELFILSSNLFILSFSIFIPPGDTYPNPTPYHF